VNKGPLLRMKGDDIQLALVSPFEALSNLNISADKVASELIPLPDESSR